MGIRVNNNLGFIVRSDGHEYMGARRSTYQLLCVVSLRVICFISVLRITIFKVSDKAYVPRSFLDCPF